MKMQKVDDLVPAPPIKEERLSASERKALNSPKSGTFQKGQQVKLKRSFWGHQPGTAGRITKTMPPDKVNNYSATMKLKGSPPAHLRDTDRGDLVDSAKRIVNRVLEMEYPGLGGSPDQQSYVAPPENFAMGRISADEVDMGQRMEMEHTDDPEEAWQIAMDHLAEDPEYYTKLHRAGIGQDTSPPKSYMVGSGSATSSMSGTTSGGGF